MVYRGTRETFESMRVPIGIIMMVLCNMFNTVRGSYNMMRVYNVYIVYEYQIKNKPVDSDRL